MDLLLTLFALLLLLFSPAIAGLFFILAFHWPWLGRLLLPRPRAFSSAAYAGGRSDFDINAGIQTHI